MGGMKNKGSGTAATLLILFFPVFLLGVLCGSVKQIFLTGKHFIEESFFQSLKKMYGDEK